MKKLIIVGSTGVIGKKIVELLGKDYDIIEINRSSGDYRLDMQDGDAVEKTFERIGRFDGLVSASGYGKWASMDELSTQDYHDGHFASPCFLFVHTNNTYTAQRQIIFQCISHANFYRNNIPHFAVLDPNNTEVLPLKHLSV